MPKKDSKWLPKFLGNNVLTAKEHIEKFQDVLEEHELKYNPEDVVMKHFPLSWEEVRMWFNNLDDSGIEIYNSFRDAFMEQKDVKKGGRLLTNELHEIKKKENGTVREFNFKFKVLG